MHITHFERNLPLKYFSAYTIMSLHSWLGWTSFFTSFYSVQDSPHKNINHCSLKTDQFFFFLSKKYSTSPKRQQRATKIQPDRPRILCSCVLVPCDWHVNVPHNCTYHQLIPVQGLWHWCSAAGRLLQVSWRIPGSTCSWLLLQAIELLITQQICTFP